MAKLMRLNQMMHGLLGNLSWMMVAEILSRLSRFVTLFVLAASFSSAQYGTVMLALLCHDLLRVFTRLGAGAKIIQCKDEVVMGVSANAATLQWAVAFLVAFSQILLAPVLAQFYGNPDLEVLLRTMAVAHVIYPMVTVKVFQLQRANRMRYFGIASGSCIAFENLLVALLVFLDANMMMVAYTKIAAAVFWVMLFYPAVSSSVGLAWNNHIMKELLSFAGKVLGSELVKAFRGQADSLFAARLLSPELFGVYSFAKSASLGISQSFSTAYLSALYPYLCQQRRNNNWHKGLRYAAIATVVIMLGYLLQALLAPWYIELLFGDRWVEAISVAVLMCLAAIPVLFADTLSTLWRIQNKVGLELIYTAICAGLLAGALLLFQPQTCLHIVWLMLTVSVIWVVFGVGMSVMLRLKKPAATLRPRPIVHSP